MSIARTAHSCWSTDTARVRTACSRRVRGVVGVVEWLPPPAAGSSAIIAGLLVDTSVGAAFSEDDVESSMASCLYFIHRLSTEELFTVKNNINTEISKPVAILVCFAVFSFFFCLSILILKNKF